MERDWRQEAREEAARVVQVRGTASVLGMCLGGTKSRGKPD